MPKGQTCLTCNATCCRGIIGYKYTPEAEEKVTALVNSGKMDWSKSSPMTYSHQELMRWGLVELRLPESKPCKSLTADMKCAKEHHKPRLCRTYWCHGKYWTPKGVNYANTEAKR